MRICRHWGVAYPKSWDNYLPCNNLNLRTSLKNTIYTSMCWISTTKEETSAALKRCQQLAGELEKRVSHGERGEKEELKHVPGPSLLQLYECTRTQTTSSILRGNYFNWKFYTALLIKFEGIMKTFKKNFYQKRTQKWATRGYSLKETGGKISGQWGMNITDSRERPTVSARQTDPQDKDKPTS